MLAAVAAFLIFSRLGTPSLWLDEAATPLNARYPFSYLLALSRTLEEHPPFFYQLHKLVLAFGHGDALIRLPSALSGLGCVFLTAFLGRRLYGWPAGILAGAVWLAMPQDLWLSRMARPYTLWQFLFLISLFFLLRFIRRRRGRDLWLLLLANCLMTAIHYLSFFLMAAEAVCLVVTRRDIPLRFRLRAAAFYVAGVGGIVAGAYFYLLRHSKNPQAILDEGAGLWQMASTLAQAVGQTLYYFEVPAAQVLWFAVTCAGFWLLWRRNRTVFLFLAPLAVVPLGLLVLFGKTLGLYSRHLSFLAVPVSLAVAGGIASLRPMAGRLGLVTVLVLALTATDALVLHRKEYYDLHSYQVPVIGCNYQETADVLAAMRTPDTILSYSNDFFGHAVAWYLAQKPRPNAVYDQRLTEADKTARLLYACSIHHGYLAWTEQEFRAKFGPDVTVTRVNTSTLYAITISRQPVQRINALPQAVTLSAAYPGFLATANSLDGLRFHQNARSPALVPTQNGVDSSVSFVYENHAPAGAQDIFLNIVFDNLGQDSRLSARIAFDDEPATEQVLSVGYDASHQRQLHLARQTPYKRLTVTLVLNCATRTPRDVGGNLETLRLRDVDAFFCPQRDGDVCREAATSRLTASVLGNYAEERFVAADAPAVPATVVAKTNLAQKDGEGQQGWNRLVPADTEAPARLRLDVTTDAPRLLFFPRVGKNASLRVWRLENGQPRELLFGLYNAAARWTPVSARYELAVPPPLRGRPLSLLVELEGPWAQLWRRGEAIFFPVRE